MSHEQVASAIALLEKRLEAKDEEAGRTAELLQSMEARIRSLMKASDTSEQMRMLEQERVENDSVKSVSVSDEEERDVVSVGERVATSHYKPTKPPLFNGLPSPTRARIWRGFKIQFNGFIRELIQLGEPVNEARKVQLFVQNLDSPAVILGANIQSRLLSKGPVSMISFDQFVQKLDKVYMRKNIAALYDDLFTIEQGVDESVDQYYERFMALLSELLDGRDVQKEIATNWFTKGLSDVLKQKVIYRCRADMVLDVFAENEPEEAVEKCFDIASAEEQMIISSGRGYLLRRRSATVVMNKSQSTSGEASKPNTQPWRSSAASRQPSVPPATSPSTHRISEGEKRRSGPKCYSCGENGHIARECKTAKKTSLNNVNAFGPLADDSDADVDANKSETQTKK